MPAIINQKFRSAFIFVNYLFILCFFIRIPVLTNKLEILWGTVACCIFICAQRKIRLDIRELLLIATMLLYALISHRNFAGVLDVVLLPAIFSLIGLYTIYDAPDEQGRQKAIYIMAALLIAGYTIHGFLNSLILYKMGIDNVIRHWMDIWDGVITPATQHVLYYLPVMSMLFPAVIYMKKHIWPSMAIVLFNLYFLFISIKTTSRISLIIWGLVLIWELFLWYVLNRKRISWKKALKIVVPIILLCAVFLAFFLWAYFTDEALASRLYWLSRDGGIINNIRFKAQINALKQIPLYPMGGSQMDLLGLMHSHNVWIDLANVAGVIPFTLFICYTVITFMDFLKLLKSPDIPYEIKYIVSGLYVAFFLYYMVETALDASVLNMLPWVYINAISYAYLSILKTETNKADCNES